MIADMPADYIKTCESFRPSLVDPLVLQSQTRLGSSPDKHPGKPHLGTHLCSLTPAFMLTLVVCTSLALAAQARAHSHCRLMAGVSSLPRPSGKHTAAIISKCNDS